jgi:hypothetical protein
MDRPRKSVFALIVLLCGTVALAAGKSNRQQKFARPPKWSADVLDAFYPDAREKLVGPRPNYDQQQQVAASDSSSNATQAAAQGATAGWSKLIDAETVETEVKRLAQSVAKDVGTLGEFKGGSYKDCRRHFSVLAALFAIDAEYDGDIRWHDAASALRDSFSRAGHNCKAGSDQTFQEAKQCKQDLADLIAGNKPKASEAERQADWSKVADRPPLMQRMNIAHEERLKKWLANKGEFTAHRDEIRHEAQLVATIAEIISHEGFDSASDEEYLKLSHELRQAASDISAAVELDNFEQSQQAIGRATKACANCHEAYRG